MPELEFGVTVKVRVRVSYHETLCINSWLVSRKALCNEKEMGLYCKQQKVGWDLEMRLVVCAVGCATALLVCPPIGGHTNNLPTFNFLLSTV